MKTRISVQERLKDLRVEQGLNLEELAQKTGISKSALGSYENDNDEYKEINHGSLLKLADFYQVSVDYLLGLTNNRKYENTPIEELHLSDEVVELLKSERFNNRLLCEIISHEKFKELLADAEIYVDGMATMRFHDMNSSLAAVRAMILEAHNLTFYYRNRKKKPVINGFELTITPGERIGLKGPSGRGKTTLCRLLAGYERPKRGQVLLDGKPVSEYRGACPVQMVWQHPETVADPLLRLKETMAEAGDIEERLMDRLYIEREWLDRYPSELSGGELQRFCLARALRPETKILLCDEITAMLDLVTQAQIWEFLLEEAERREMGMLVVSHSEALLEKVCTRIINL